MMVRMPDLTKSTVALKSPVLASRAMTRPFPWMAWVTDEPTQAEEGVCLHGVGTYKKSPGVSAHGDDSPGGAGVSGQRSDSRASRCLRFARMD